MKGIAQQRKIGRKQRIKDKLGFDKRYGESKKISEWIV